MDKYLFRQNKWLQIYQNSLTPQTNQNQNQNSTSANLEAKQKTRHMWLSNIQSSSLQ